jgi:hypothetical protein
VRQSPADNNISMEAEDIVGIHCQATPSETIEDLMCAESESYVMTDGQPAGLSWNQAPFWGLRPDLYYCLTVAGFFIWGALSDERTGPSFTIAAGPRQRSSFRVQVP